MKNNSDKIRLHFQTNYCVVIGHPCNANGPSLNMTYYSVMNKETFKKDGNMGSLEFAQMLLNEINLEYSTDLFCLVQEIKLEFIKGLTK